MGKIVIVSGSPSHTSRLKGVLDLANDELQKAEHQVNWVHVRDLPAEDLLHARFDSPAIEAAAKLIEHAEGVIVATPVYKASYTGILKAFLDLLPQKGLAQKTILPLAIGGTIAHLLVIDYALKPVLSVLGARNILSGVYVLDTQVKWNEQGKAEIDDEISARLSSAVQQFAQEVEAQNKNLILKGV